MDGISLLQDFAIVLIVAGISGWIFRRLNLSAVVGYLVAGIIIGPFTPPFTLVTDVGRIETLTDLGLAFLMFFVGLGLSLKRIRRLGIGVVVTTAITAFLVFQFAHGFAAALGWSGDVAFIFAAMLMASSSAIIIKMLAEAGLTHERFAQNAQGITVLEDIVAIVLLTILGSKFQMAGTESRAVGDTLFLLLGFTALVVVSGLLFVPRILAGFSKPADADLNAVLVSGMVFIAGVASIQAGFSVALGAFLFGLVVAETPFKQRIEKSLAGAQDMFSAIFFVAIGMLIDVHAFYENAGLILGISVFAILARSLAASVGFVLTGSPVPLAVGSAVVVTPIGEFAYVIAQIGVDAEVVPSSFYAVAVGVSIITAICAPVLAKNSERIGNAMGWLQPKWFARGVAAYHGMIGRASIGFQQNHVWKLTRRRTGMAVVVILLLGGLFGFAMPLRQGIETMVLAAGYEGVHWEAIYWIGFIAITIALLAALWISMQTLCMIYAELLTMRSRNAAVKRVIAQFILQLGVASVMAVSVWRFFPLRSSSPVLLGAISLVLFIFLLLLWRRLGRLGIRFENSLSSQDSQNQRRSQTAALLGGAEEANWGLDVAECEIPEDAACVGKSIRDLAIRPKFGCLIIEIDRQGFVIDRIKPDELIFPGDRILLVGKPEQIAEANEFLTLSRAPDESEDVEADFDEAFLDVRVVPESSRLAEMTLAEAQVYENAGVLVMGIERDGVRTMNPGGEETIHVGDRLLVMGNSVGIRNFESWITP